MKLPSLFPEIGYRILKAYWRLARPTTLGSRALVLREGRIRLVRLTYAKGWYLPGGGVDRGESFEQAIIRELKEECALVVQKPELFGLYLSRKQGKTDHVAIFVVTDFREVAGAKPDQEIAEQKDFPLDELPGDVTPATKRRIEEYLKLRPQTEVW